MGRYTDADSDAGRLPDGMRRVGYDSDTQVYTFRDTDGSLWESLPGAEYGRLHRAGRTPLISPEEAAAEEAAVAQQTRASWRMMMPFLLLVLLVPVLVFRMLPRGSTPTIVDCGEGAQAVFVNQGDSCWSIAEEHGMSLEEFMDFNKEREVDIECETLDVGKRVCVRET